MFWIPGVGGADSAIRRITSNVFRPMRKVSNRAINAAKSMSGSDTIQS